MSKRWQNLYFGVNYSYMSFFLAFCSICEATCCCYAFVCTTTRGLWLLRLPYIKNPRGDFNRTPSRFLKKGFKRWTATARQIDLKRRAATVALTAQLEKCLFTLFVFIWASAFRLRAFVLKMTEITEAFVQSVISSTRTLKNGSVAYKWPYPRSFLTSHS